MSILSTLKRWWMFWTTDPPLEREQPEQANWGDAVGNVRKLPRRVQDDGLDWPPDD